jgi:hypothetical protein
MSSFRNDRFQAIPLPLRVILVAPFLLAALGLSFYWWSQEAGPYRWLLELQLALLGVGFPRFTGFVLVCLAIGAGVFLPTYLYSFLVQMEASLRSASSPADPRRLPPFQADSTARGGRNGDSWLEQGEAPRSRRRPPPADATDGISE